MRLAHGAALCATLAGLSLLIGCDAAKEIAQKVKDKASDVLDEDADDDRDGKGKADAKGSSAAVKPKQPAGFAGSVNGRLETPFQTTGCFARFIPPVDGRAGVLQLRSYYSNDAEEFPSVYVHVPHQAASLQDMLNQTLPARVFVQRDENGPVWSNLEGQEVLLKVTETGTAAVSALINDGPLRSSDTGETSPLNCNFNAVLR